MEEAGHSVEVISLLRYEVKGCLGCNACRYGKPCVQKDGFKDLTPKIMEAERAVTEARLRGGEALVDLANPEARRAVMLATTPRVSALRSSACKSAGIPEWTPEKAPNGRALQGSRPPT